MTHKTSHLDHQRKHQEAENDQLFREVVVQGRVRYVRERTQPR